MSYGGYQQGGGYPPPGGGGYQPGSAFPPPSQYGYGMQPLQYADMGKRFVAALLDGLVSMVGALPGIILMIIGVAVAASNADSRGRVGDDAAGAMAGLFVLGYLLIIVGAI